MSGRRRLSRSRHSRVSAFLPADSTRILGEHNTTIVVEMIFVHGGVHMNHVQYGLGI